MEIIANNPEKAVVLWDDVYSTGATLEAIEKLIRAKIAMKNELINQAREAVEVSNGNEGNSRSKEKLISLKHFYRAVTAWEYEPDKPQPENLRFAFQIPVILGNLRQ